MASLPRRVEIISGIKGISIFDSYLVKNIRDMEAKDTTWSHRIVDITIDKEYKEYLIDIYMKFIH